MAKTREPDKFYHYNGVDYKITPMMEQFLGIKEQYPEQILFFRMGDFYEMFFEDAIYASRVLNIALTRRQDGVPMCGIPYHSMNNYIYPLLDSGRNIAICEQLEDPSQVESGIVKRGVIRILTPGSIYEEDLLARDERRQILAVIEDGGSYLSAVCDISTGDITIDQGEQPVALDGLEIRGIREVVADKKSSVIENGTLAFSLRLLPPETKKKEFLEKGFGVKNISVLELSQGELDAVALLFAYVYEINPGLNLRWKLPRKGYLEKRMVLDETALKTLEIVQSQSGEKSESLAGVLDQTKTAAGRRWLAESLVKPSADLQLIIARQDVVAYAIANRSVSEEIRREMYETYDIERILSSLQNNPQVKNLGDIYYTLRSLLKIREVVSGGDGTIPELLQGWGDSPFPSALYDKLETSLHLDELPPLLDERRCIASGVSAELDQLFTLGDSAGAVMLEYERSEKEKTGINTLKVRYNRVIGYYIEISKTQTEKAPSHYLRRQTLVNGERYTTEELKQLEDRVLGARERIIELQRHLFEGLVSAVLDQLVSLRNWAELLAMTDTLFSFAEVAIVQRYSRPELFEKGDFVLKESRHPVVEKLFHSELFVPNDIHLNNSDRHLAVLTGPNMAGKSTFIRQVGLIQIMAQAGSFVPAASARIPLSDRVFTRIGAYDRLSKGESTFYVEMAECARIFSHFTGSSLVLLDEVGRGTSTFDGISIARAMIEYLNNPSYGRPRTLFATHYGELSGMIEPNRGIVGLTVKVVEEKDKIIFLRKIVEGAADKSYGIYVAELAGMKPEVIGRARELLAELEDEGIWHKEPVFQEKPAPKARQKGGASKNKEQLSIFPSTDS